MSSDGCTQKLTTKQPSQGLRQQGPGLCPPTTRAPSPSVWALGWTSPPEESDKVHEAEMRRRGKGGGRMGGGHLLGEVIRGHHAATHRKLSGE